MNTLRYYAPLVQPRGEWYALCRSECVVKLAPPFFGARYVAVRESRRA